MIVNSWAIHVFPYLRLPTTLATQQQLVVLLSSVQQFPGNRQAWLMVVCWSLSIQHREEETSTEKLSPRDWLVSVYLCVFGGFWFSFDDHKELLFQLGMPYSHRAATVCKCVAHPEGPVSDPQPAASLSSSGQQLLSISPLSMLLPDRWNLWSVPEPSLVLWRSFIGMKTDFYRKHHFLDCWLM